MDVTNLVLNLKSKIGVESIDQQMLSKAIKLLELGIVETVSSFSDLPNVATTGRDKLYLVEYDGLYKTNGTNWIPFITGNVSNIFNWGVPCVGVSVSSPVSILGGFTDWCDVSSGYSQGLGVRTNGTAWCIGGPTNTPVLVPGGFTDWCQVSAVRAGFHALAVRQNGTAWGWGVNVSGACGGWIGDGTCITRTSPVSVIGGFTDWCQVSAGCNHSLGVRQNGTAWGWGRNVWGENGSGDGFDKNAPCIVVGGFTDWCQVSAGFGFSLGVRKNGVAMGWGAGACGIRGDGTTISVGTSPQAVVGGFTDWCQVSAGYFHGLGVRQNGTLWAWGNNVCGRLGDGTTVAKSSPVSVVGGFTNWCQASAGRDHSLGVRTNGTAWAWGCNACGVLGDGTTVAKSSPVSIVGGFTDWCQVSAERLYNTGIRKTNI
jgi:alpha-tubulin suppressor-like RCC1 family protein